MWGCVYTQTFDAENRLISVAVSGQTTQFVYDGDGNLIKKINPNGSKTLYVGGIYEVDKASGGSVTRTVTYYPVAGAMRINSTLYYILKDHLGSASVVTDASGVTVGEQRYYPYGETRVPTGTIYTDKLFTGQREMAGLGIYHYQARFYSPKIGRFLSADTIVPNFANPQHLNRFGYVLNNPIRYNDPTGHVCSDPDDPSPSCSSGNPYPNNTQPLPEGPVDPGGPLDPGLPQGGGDNDDGPNLGGGQPLPSLIPNTGDDCLANCVYTSYETLETYLNGFYQYYQGTLWVSAFLVGGIALAGLATCVTTGFLPACAAAVIGIPFAIELAFEASESGQISRYLFSELGTLQPGEITTISLQTTDNGNELQGGNTSYGLDVDMPINTFILDLFVNP